MKYILIISLTVLFSCELIPKQLSKREYVVNETAVKEIKILQEFGEDARVFSTYDGRLYKCRLYGTESVRIGDSIGLTINEFVYENGHVSRYTKLKIDHCDRCHIFCD